MGEQGTPVSLGAVGKSLRSQPPLSGEDEGMGWEGLGSLRADAHTLSASPGQARFFPITHHRAPSPGHSRQAGLVQASGARVDPAARSAAQPLPTPASLPPPGPR